MSGTVVVTGIPGVGASRVCQQARRELGDEFTLVNFGDVMLEEGLEVGLVDSRGDLASLSMADQRMLQRRASEQIARRPDDETLIINTHIVIRTDYGFIEGMPEAVLSDIDPTAFVVVDTSVETIQQRREGSERDYIDETASSLSFHRNLQNAAAFNYAAAANAPVRQIANDDLDAAAEELEMMAEAAARS